MINFYLKLFFIYSRMIKEFASYNESRGTALVGKLAILKDRENALYTNDRENALYTYGDFVKTGNPVGWSVNIISVKIIKGKTLINRLLV